MITESQVQQVQISATEARDYLKFADEAKKLISNPQFKTVITEGYMTNEAVRLVRELGSDRNQSDEVQAILHKQLYAISYLDQFFKGIQGTASLMRVQLNDAEALLDSVSEEEEE